MAHYLQMHYANKLSCFINSRNTFENKWNYPIIELLILNSKKMTKVMNVNGTSRFSVPSGYNSWLDYWEK